MRALLVVLFYTLGVFNVSADSYVITNLIDPVTGSDIFPSSINSSGVVVGTDGSQGFIYGPSSFSTYDYVGSTRTWLDAINDDGTIIGSYSTSPTTHEQFILSGGTATPLQVNLPQAVVSGINNEGVLVGRYIDELGTVHGFIAGDILTTVDDAAGFGGGTGMTQLTDINNAGIASGFSFGNQSFATRAFTTDGNSFSYGPNVAAGINGGIYFNSAGGINNSGAIVGMYQGEIGGIYKQRGYVWSAGSFTTFDLPGATGLLLKDINDKGQVIGEYFDTEGRRHGFLATPGTPGVSSDPTLIELATLSNNVYSGDAGVGAFQFVREDVLPREADYEGFRAAAYVSEDGSEVVIAFRGTIFEPLTRTLATLKTLLTADFSFVKGSPTPDLEKSVDLATNFLNEIREQFPNARITLTGHSLGGAIAQILGEASGFSTAAFNAPGAAGVFDSLMSGRNVVTCANQCGDNKNYRLDDDIISLVGNSIGTQLTISAEHPYAALGSTPIEFWMSSFDEVAGEHHAIGTIISQLAAGKVPEISIVDPRLFQYLATMEEIIFPTSIVTLTADALDPRKLVVLSTFSFLVSEAGGLSRLIDPVAASQFLFMGDAGSPQLSCVALPALAGVSNYRRRLVHANRNVARRGPMLWDPGRWNSI